MSEIQVLTFMINNLMLVIGRKSRIVIGIQSLMLEIEIRSFMSEIQSQKQMQLEIEQIHQLGEDTPLGRKL
jgi:hypothetical protein